MPEAYASSIDRLRDVAGTPRDPNGHAFAMIAEYLRRDGKLDEARRVVEEGILANPDFASGHVVAVQVLMDLGDLEQAKTALARVLELDGGNTRASGLKQGLVAAEEEAAVEWARAQGAGPSVEVDDEVVTATLGELYLEQGAPDKAADVARQILATDPGHAAALALLAKVEGGAVEVEAEPVEAEPVEEAPIAEEPAEAAAVADLASIAVPVEELGPDAVPIASLAPDAVPVESLAPDPETPAATAQPPAQKPEAVPVADLAPDSVTGVDAQAVSPQTEEGGDTPAKAAGEEGMDDFMSWLDEH